VSDIDIAVADSLKVLDLKRPIREATKIARRRNMSRWAKRRHRRLFYYLVGEREQRCWNSKPKRLGGLKIDHQLELGWLFNRQVCGLGTLKILSM
jgi:hypothetical protein